MRLQIEAKSLADILAKSGLAIKDIGVPVLLCVKLEAKDNRLVSVGTNQEIEIQAHCDAAVSQAGECCANFSDLRAIASRVKGCVSLEATDSGLRVTCNGVDLTIPTLHDSFPRMSRPEGEVEATFGVDAIKSCVPFCADVKSRPSASGVIFSNDHAVGLNGVRLYVTPSTGGQGQIVPHTAAPIAAKLGGRLFLSKTTWRIEAQGSAALGRLLDFQPFDWQRVTFKADPIMSFDADDMVGAVQAATLGRAKNVVIEANGGNAKVSGDSFGGQHISGGCDVRCDGEAVTFVIPTKDALDCISAHSGCVVSLTTNGNFLMFTPHGREGFTMVGALKDARTHLPVAA